MNILFLTQRLPYTPNRGDRIRAYHLMEAMSRFAAISLFSLVHDDDEAEHADSVPFADRVAISRVPRLRNLAEGAVSLAGSRPLTHILLNAPDARQKLRALVERRRPDLVFAYCTSMARFGLEPPLDGLPMALDVVDVDSAKWQRLSRRATAPRSWIYAREARTLAAFEADAAARARCVLVVNEREQAALKAIAPGVQAHVLRNGIDVTSFAPPSPPSPDPVAVFCGVMDYEPNVEAVCWFATRVWPRVRADRPDARFVIVGSNPASAVQALAHRDASITVTGRVDRVQPHLWNAAVSIAPLFVAQGVQNKVLEALAAGLPVVITSAVGAGLPAIVQKGCATADDAAPFARAVLELMNLAPEARRAMAAAAKVQFLSWSAQLAPLQGWLEEAAMPRTSDARVFH